MADTPESTPEPTCESNEDRPAVTGTPVSGTKARAEALTGDDASGDAVGGTDGYPADGVSPDRGSSAPRD